MTNKITQDWDELKKAVSQIRSFLSELPSPLSLGGVVKTEDGLIGVVTGIDAPEHLGLPWTYAVCFPDTEDHLESETVWYEADQLELMHWQDGLKGGIDA